MPDIYTECKIVTIFNRTLTLFIWYDAVLSVSADISRYIVCIDGLALTTWVLVLVLSYTTEWGLVERYSLRLGWCSTNCRCPRSTSCLSMQDGSFWRKVVSTSWTAMSAKVIYNTTSLIIWTLSVSVTCGRRCLLTLSTTRIWTLFSSNPLTQHEDP